jgi:hypothetical protein
VNRLHITGVDRGYRCELILIVDGSDVLMDLDAAGLDSDELLEGLQPPEAPRTVRLGRCECGDDDCGSVLVRITAEGDGVVWDGWSSSFGDHLPPPFRFDRAEYLAELSAAEGRPWESEERHFARQVGELIDAEVRSALSWRGLTYQEVVPAGDGLVAVRLSAGYREAEWSVYVVVSVSEDPEYVRYLLSRRGPTAWPNVFWWGENEAAAFRQPPMAGRRWRMWKPDDL